MLRRSGRSLSRGCFSLLLSALALLACTERQPPAEPDAKRPHIVLVVIDTLRADHLGAYGYGRPTSPTLDRLAADGTLFEDATAVTSWTRPSIASLFTSRLPSEHGVVASLSELDSDVPTLAELLSAAGYDTLGVSGNFPHLNASSGLDRGFERFVSVAMPGNDPQGDTLMRLELSPGARPAPLRAPTAEELNARVLEALPEAPEDRPLLLYVHYMDPHSGYLPPRELQERFRRSSVEGPSPTSDYVVELAAGRRPSSAAERDRLVDLYDAEIASVDAALGSLLAALDERGFGEDAVVVVLSDHGEEFLDHDGWFHGMTLHDELLRVPLVFHDARGVLPVGRRDEPVELLDVAPTLLALAGAPPPAELRGRPLFGAGSHGEPQARIAELHPDGLREAAAGRRRHAAAVTEGSFKVLIAPDGALLAFDLSRDRAERSPLPPAQLPEGLLGRARERAAAVVATTAAPGDVSDEEREALRALGYAE